ncbi:MAG: hypothetical protein ACR2QI_01785 [Woeseiaceae bacterium]
MLESAAGKATSFAETLHDIAEKHRVISRKVWLPKLLYDSLPFFYLASGIAAFLATIYITEWFWVLPHYVIFSAACIHLGVVVYRRRHRKRT